MSSGGWLKLHRKILDSQVFQNEGVFKVWAWCLLRASRRTRFVPVKIGRGSTEVGLKPGEFIFGRKSAAEKLNMDESTVYDRMHKLARIGCISMQPNKHYSIVTVCNWGIYQDECPDEQQPSHHPSNTRATAGQHKQEGLRRFEKVEEERESPADTGLLPQKELFEGGTEEGQAHPKKASQKRASKSTSGASACPPALAQLIHLWNSLGPAIVATGNGARSDPPAKEVLKAYEKAMADPEQRAALSDLSRLEKEIYASSFVHGKPWFTLSQLISGKNRNGESILQRLLAGGYRDDPPRNGSAQGGNVARVHGGDDFSSLPAQSNEDQGNESSGEPR